MTTNVNDLDPMSPEFDAAMERLQDEEDQASGNLERGVPSDQPKDPTAKQDSAPEAPETGSAEAPGAVGDPDKSTPADPAGPDATAKKAIGVASKDGTRVLPYSALQAERRAAASERRARERAEADLEDARRQLEAMRSGKPAPKQDASSLTDEQLADMEASYGDVPEVAAVIRETKALRERVARVASEGSKTTEEDSQETMRETVQSAIDEVPSLLEWQLEDPEKFSRAQEFDALLIKSPKWAGKPLADRFREAARLVADEFDITLDSPPQPSTAPSAAPRKAVDRTEDAPRAKPNTLSDLKGGAVDQSDDLNGLSPNASVARFSKMTDAEIDRYLERLG